MTTISTTGIDATKPVEGNATTKSVRDNFAEIKVQLNNAGTDIDGKEPADATILKDADIGVSVQAYDATYLVDADIGVNVEAYDATILKDADIGVTVQAYGESVQVFDTVALMKAESLAAGEAVMTRGYSAAGDGGGATYLIVAPQAFDGYGDHELANGNIAVLQAEIGGRRIGQYGVKGTADDSAALQAAVNASANETLRIDIDATVESGISGISDIIIKGDGGSITNIDPSAASDISILNFNGKSNFRIEGVKLVGSNKSIAPSNSFGVGVYCIDCTDFDILNNDLSLFSANGIMVNTTALVTSENFRINGNTVSTGNAAYTGDDITVVGLGVSRKFDVSGNICISPNGSGIGISQQALGTGSIFDFSVTNNIVRGKTHHGIYLYAGSTGAYTPFRAVIANNVITEIDWIGIYLNEDSKHIIVTGNVISDTCKSISGSLPWACIGAVSTGKAAQHLIITDNICNGFNGYSGINVKGASFATVSGNTVIGDGTARVGSTDNGISLINVATSNIRNNLINLSNAEGDGISIGRSDASSYSNNSIHGNVIENPSLSGIRFAYQNNGSVSLNKISSVTTQGIYIQGSNDSNVHSNILDSGAAQDIYCTDTNNRISIYRNKMVSARVSGAAIQLDAATSSDCILEDNDVSQVVNIDSGSKIVDSGTRTQILRNKYNNDSLTGSFTCAANTNTTVTNSNARGGMKVTLLPTNAPAATLQGSSKNLFLNAITTDVSFIVTTADGTAAAGTETFNYIIE